MITQILKTWRALRRRRNWESDLDDELRLHLELRAADLERDGIPRDQAKRQARIELGARESYKEEARAAFGLRWLDEFVQDFRYSCRILRKSSAFAAVAIISLGLGVGANTVVFGVLNTLLFKPLVGIAAPDGVYFVQPDRGTGMSFPNYRDVRDRNSTFAGVIASRFVAGGLTTDSGVERLWGYLATGNYFDVLGVRPALGRFFHAEEDRMAGGSPYVVLSYASWQTRFHGDPGIIGRNIRISSLPYTVLGVASRGFRGTEIFYVPEFWVPMSMQPQLENSPWLEDRNTQNSLVYARLKPGATQTQSEADLKQMVADLAREYPRVNDGLSLSLAQPGMMGNLLRGPMQGFVVGVMILAGLVLVAACANVASLLAARSRDRFREIAVRVSIGASRARVVRQLLTESILLTALGGLCGTAAAVWLLGILSAWRLPLDISAQFDIEADPRVLVFAAAVTMAAGVLAGIGPVRQAWGTNPNDALKGTQAAGTTRHKWAARDLLFAAQVALCCILVTACLVAFRGLARAVSARPGFEVQGTSIVVFDLGMARYSPADGGRFRRRALESVLQLPGVTAAGYASSVPLSLDQSMTEVFPEQAAGFTVRAGTLATYYHVSPGYFAAIGTRLLRGRDFSWRDGREAPPVAIVNETFARQVAGTADAVGRLFRYADRTLVEIVGVVEDGQYISLTEEPRPALFRPAEQWYSPETVLIVRAVIDGAHANEMRKAIAGLDSTLPVHRTGSLAQHIGVAFFPAKAATVALAAFGALAAMLAITGIYGIASYSVSQRVREIGIRIAVGAQRRHVLRFVLGRTVVLLVVGSALGIAGGAAASRLLANIVYQASPRDPLVLGSVAATMAIIALASALGPARRAISTDPLRALRQD
jgi:predicted permease